MKLNVLLSILFAIVTSLSAVHEVEHIAHDDASTCLECVVNQNLVSADAVLSALKLEIFHFEKISHNNHSSHIHVRTHSNQNRAPPTQF